ncbi:hypothetical protein ACT3R3_09385 [Glutamicibacter sp. AOP5-B1-3]
MHSKFYDFIALARRLDPDGKFRNEFLRRNIFGAQSLKRLDLYSAGSTPTGSIAQQQSVPCPPSP